MSVTTFSRARVGEEGARFAAQLAQASVEHRASGCNFHEVVDAAIGRGADRHTPKRRTLDEQDGEYN